MCTNLHNSVIITERKVDYRASTKRKQTRSGYMACRQSTVTCTTQFPAQINQQHKPFNYCRTTKSLDILYSAVQLAITLHHNINYTQHKVHSSFILALHDNLGLVSLIYLGWELCGVILCSYSVYKAS